MKLNQNFITHTTGGQYYVVSTDSTAFKGIIRGNGTTGDIIELLKNDTTEDAIVDALFEKYDAPREKIAADVSTVLTKLRSVGAIDDD
ncbi:MAG: PqqD family protein [Clostridia bacterium]|nr:PqqD family protein [Clostridia bacterium]MBQ3867830.1 PqqD family protein [Clostridia bacterium]MBR0159216.1 PqqD family protein [Clostridia bacterium]MBR7063135.1 PqqD family protein [Clostridia bacterium]